MTVSLRSRCHYISVDPGKLSGIAVLGNDGRFHSYELGWPDANRVLERFALNCRQHRELLRVVGERYDHQGTRGKQDDLSWSLKVLGCWQNEAARYGFEYEERGRSDAKSFMNNGDLKKLGWKHSGGEGHADDAARILALDLSVTDPSYWKSLVLGSGLLLGGEQHDSNGGD